MKTVCLWFLITFAAALAAVASPVTAQEPAAEPETARDFLNAGYRLLQNDRPADAVAMFERGIAQHADQAFLYRYLAIAHYAAGDAEAALQAARQRGRISAAADLVRLREQKGDELLGSADEVLERHIEAIGGRDALAGVRTLVVEYTGNSTRGSIATIRRSFKRPGLFRQEVVGRPGFTTTDGTTTWRFRDGQWQESGDRAYRHIASIDNYLVDYERWDVTYEFAGLEIFSDTPVYHLVRTFSDSHREDLYFSEATGLLTEIVAPYPDGNPMMTSAMSYWDYRDVGGIRLPHVFIRNVGDLGTPHGGVVQSVRVNEELDDDLFLPPNRRTGGEEEK